MITIPQDKMLTADIETITDNFLVPAADSTDNVIVSDVVGTKLDSHSGNSLYGLAKVQDEHIHSVSRVCPDLADSVILTANAGDWVLGTAVDIVAANAITSDFDIHEIMVEDVSTINKGYQVNLYRKDNDAFLGAVKFGVYSNVASPTAGTFQTPLIPANTGVYGKVAIQDGNGSATVTLSIRYHIY